jgi:hypothetical protein
MTTIAAAATRDLIHDAIKEGITHSLSQEKSNHGSNKEARSSSLNIVNSGLRQNNGASAKMPATALTL